jgi:choline dehydrogenase
MLYEFRFISIVLRRLSKNNRVLLLEAGGHPIYISSIPGFAMELLHKSEVDWMYSTLPQKNALWGQTGQVSRWPRGKQLGGSSNLNHMGKTCTYIRYITKIPIYL